MRIIRHKPKMSNYAVEDVLVRAELRDTSSHLTEFSNTGNKKRPGENAP